MQIDGTNDFIFNYQLLNNGLATFTNAMQRLFSFSCTKMPCK